MGLFSFFLGAHSLKVFIIIIIYLFNLFIWLRQVLVTACTIFIAARRICVVACELLVVAVESSSLTRDQTRPPALGAWSLSHWTTREVPLRSFF